MRVSPLLALKGLKSHDIIHSTQLQFLQRFLFASIGPPSLQAYGSGHTAMDSLSGWPPHRSLNHKLCRCLVVRNPPQHRRLVTGCQLYRQRIPLQECLDNPFVLVQMSSPGHVGRHLVQDTKENKKCLVRNPWEKSMLETPSGLKGIQVMPRTTRPDSPGEPGMQPRDPCLPWRGILGPGHTPRWVSSALQ